MDSKRRVVPGARSVFSWKQRDRGHGTPQRCCAASRVAMVAATTICPTNFERRLSAAGSSVREISSRSRRSLSEGQATGRSPPPPVLQRETSRLGRSELAARSQTRWRWAAPGLCASWLWDAWRVSEAGSVCIMRPCGCVLHASVCVCLDLQSWSPVRVFSWPCSLERLRNVCHAIFWKFGSR